MIVLTDPRTAQRNEARAKANEVRLGGAAIKRQLAAGTLTLTAALAHPDALHIKVPALITALPRWGTVKATRLCGQVPVALTKTVGSLTDRQRDLIVELVEVGQGCGPVRAEHHPSVDAHALVMGAFERNVMITAGELIYQLRDDLDVPVIAAVVRDLASARVLIRDSHDPELMKLAPTRRSLA
jgi:hypothetical protein